VLVLAVAAGAWALFGRDSTTTDNASSSTPTATSAPPVFGPAAPPVKATPKASATSTQPVAAPTSAATKTATQAPVVKPTAAVRATTSPAPVATKPPAVAGPVAPKPVAKPPVTAPQQGGTVAKKDYTFKVARGDTLWDYTVSVLKSSGRSTSNANVAALVAKLYASNKAVIGTNPNLILPGQTIVWPTGL
jgi:nucleoid-associated protein YgaU